MNSRKKVENPRSSVHGGDEEQSRCGAQVKPRYYVCTVCTRYAQSVQFTLISWFIESQMNVGVLRSLRSVLARA